MKVERNARQRRTAGRKWKPAALLLAAVLAFLSLPLAGKAVYAVDLNQPCSLTISIGSSLPEADKADLQEADIVYDLYRVADAVPVSGYDTYSWKVLEPFAASFTVAELAEAQAAEDGMVISPSIDGDGWKRVAAAAAAAALGTVPEGTDFMAPAPAGTFEAGQYVAGDAPGDETGSLTKSITGLKAGLYLIVAHGRGVEEYVSTSTGIMGSGQVTIAESRHYRYSFTPELISLPTKEGLNTAQSAGDWNSDANVDMTMKFAKDVRVGNLEITKDLLTYAQREKTSEGETRTISDPATFVFDVSVYESKAAHDANGDASRIYHNYISIIFDSNGDYSLIDAGDGSYEGQPYGKKTARIENLPIDSYAVVEEVYSGKNYTKDKTKFTTITLNDNDNTVGVEFENDYNGEHGGGGSVTNKFTYSGDGSKSGWGWEQVTDSSEGSEVVDYITWDGQKSTDAE